MNVDQHTLTSIRDAIRAGELSARDATRGHLDRIGRLDGELGCCTQTFPQRAAERAEAVDAGSAAGPLAGVPVMVKDNMTTTFGRTTCGSRILEPFESPFDATAVRKLEEAGAVVLAKTNLDEFAMGSSTEHSALGVTANPWDPQRVPGGSSGGSAAAVAAALCAGALGSDTGGSIRQPAALCGVVGLKPTYGLVSRYGLVAFASSLDQIGPITRTTEDCAALLNAIAGPDPNDSTSATADCSGPIPDYTEQLDTPPDRPTIGVARQYVAESNDPAVNEAVERAIAFYRERGAEIVDVDLPHTEYGIPCYYIVATAEASSNLARYDGMHYGRRATGGDGLADRTAASRAEGFGDEVKRRIMLGTYALSSGYYGAYYLRALKVRRLIKRDFDQAFRRCDAILCPTASHPAFRFGEKSDDPLSMYMQDVYTVPANLAGIPGLSIPGGFTEREGTRLPIGIQLLGPHFSEAKLLRIARLFEQAHDHAAARPALSR